jgi:hypothetical protein
VDVAYTAFSLSGCGSFSFTTTSTLSSGAALPSLLTLTSASNKYTISTVTPGDAGTYTIRLIGTLSTEYSSVHYVDWTLTITYTTYSISTSAVDTTLYFLASDLPQTTTFSAFTYTPSNGLTFTYTFPTINACMTGTGASRTVLVSAACTSSSYSVVIRGTLSNYFATY